MRRSLLSLATAVCMSIPALAFAAPVVGEAAPAFNVKDATGKDVSIDALAGKTVVLEWSNFGCPFVQKHYEPKNMQALQKQAADAGVVWVTVFSSAKGKQGHMSEAEAIAEMKKQGGAPSHIILDPEGTLGRLYEAKTTPHMFVIDKKGVLAYMGAIDDKATADSDDIKTARNYVSAALASLNAGAPVSPSSTKPYGCSVKYAD